MERKHLPIVSSAASTAFCSEALVGVTPSDGVERTLWLDGNQKITAGNGSYADPRPNAFSLVQVETCPGSTPTCREACYVHGLEAAAKSTHDLYRHNTTTIREILADVKVGTWWAHHMAAWVRLNAGGGFRWHVSGDLFDVQYAHWIGNVIALSPEVRHWLYTRSHYMTAIFVGLDNATINYSVDRDNYRDAIPYVEAHRANGHPVRLCYMVTGDGQVPSDLPEGSVLFPDYALRGSRGESPAAQRASSAWYQSLTGAQRRMVCPVDFYGKSEGVRCGPCSKCIDPAR